MNKTFTKRYREYLKENLNNYENNPMQQRLMTAYTIAIKNNYMGIEDWYDFINYLYCNPGAEMEIILSACYSSMEKDLEELEAEATVEDRKEKRKEYCKNYYLKNKDKKIKYQKEYYQKNKTDRQEYQRGYYHSKKNLF